MSQNSPFRERSTWSVYEEQLLAYGAKIRQLQSQTVVPMAEYIRDLDVWRTAYNELSAEYEELKDKAKDRDSQSRRAKLAEARLSIAEAKYRVVKAGTISTDSWNALAARYSAQSLENADQAAGIEALRAQVHGYAKQNETLREGSDWLKLSRDALSTENAELRAAVNILQDSQARRGNGVLVPGPELEALKAELAFYKGLWEKS